MGGRRITLIVGIAAAAALVATSAQAAPKDKDGKGKRDETTILVKFAQPGYNNDDLVQQDGDQAAGAVGDLRTKTVIVRLKKGANVDDKIAEYLARADVVFAEANGVMDTSDDGGSSSPGDPTTTTPADPAGPTAQTDQAASTDSTFAATSLTSAPTDQYFGQQWSLTTIDALDAWSVFPGSFTAQDGPPIAIIDSGVDSLHADLYGRVATDLGANCLTGVCVSDGAADDYGHGTHVAGIAAARANDGLGIAGVAFEAPIIPVKALDSTGSGTYASISSGIIWAADQGARVINLSLGSTAYSQTVCDAVSYALGKGAVVVAAAGNNGTSSAFYPAACPGVVGVAATDSTDTRASFSETAYPNVFLSAPGVGILSDYPNNGLKTDSGTSMAAPFVSGVAELLLAQNAGRTPLDVKRQLAGTADKIGTSTYGGDPYGACGCTWNASYGYGRLNAYRALTEAAPAPAPDFTLATSAGTVTVQRGKSGALTVSSSSGSGFSSSVALSITGLPSGATASFSPTSVTGGGTSTLTITASTSTPYGSYSLAVKGTSGTLVRTTPLTLLVPAPDFTLKESVTAGTLVQGDKGTSSISLNPLFGFSGTVGLAVGGAPAGVTTTLSRSSISGTTAATLTLSTAATAAPGTYSITVTGTSGSLVRTAVYTLTVAQAIPDFTLTSATTSSSVRYGRATTISYKLSLAQKYGFRGTVSLSAAGTPPGTACAWSPQTVSITSTSTVYAYCSLAIPADTPVGIYSVTFTGLAANGASRTATAKITVS